MRASTYVQTLEHILASEQIPEDLAERFVNVLRTNGHTHLLPKILRQLARRTARRSLGATITVTSATPLTEKEVQALLQQSQEKALIGPQHKRVDRIVDPTLISGTVVRTRAGCVDRSAKSQLLELYHSLIA